MRPSEEDEPNGDSSLPEESASDPGCPLPLAHDRFDEAHWFLHQMLESYHHPAPFRYNLNAFLSALKAVLSMLRLDLERLGLNEWRRQRFAEVEQDPLFRRFSRGRDVVVHRGALLNDSRVEMGLFKYYKVKFAFQRDIKTDEPSHLLLARVQELNDTSEPMFVDKKRRWVGEQLGVRRMYYVPRLSPDDDVVTASHAVLLSVGNLLKDAHRKLGMDVDLADYLTLEARDVERLAILLEMDVDPSLPEKWGWTDE